MKNDSGDPRNPAYYEAAALAREERAREEKRARVQRVAESLRATASRKKETTNAHA